MQFFSRRANLLPLFLAVGGIGLSALMVTLIWYYFGPQFTQVGYSPKQPIAYSHRIHARNLGLDCRYCHANVERSSLATVPPTQTCMNCHALVKADSVKLASLRDGWESGDRIEWTPRPTSSLTTLTSITACTSGRASAASNVMVASTRWTRCVRCSRSAWGGAWIATVTCAPTRARPASCAL